MVRQSSIVWDKKAKANFKKIIGYIREHNTSAAPKVRQAIFEIIKASAKRSNIHEADRFKSNNSGEYKAFEKYHIRVTYKVETDRILILRVRHTSQNPLHY